MDMDDSNELGLSEFIVDGSYIRGLFIKHSMIIKSEVWCKQRLWIVSSGDFTYHTTKERRRIKAPYVGLAPYGESVTIFTHEDTQIYAITGVDNSMLENIKDEVIL